MAFDLSLLDLVTPYILRGDSFNTWHAALSAVLIKEHQIAIDDAGIVIRGVAVFRGSVRPYIDPTRMMIGVNAENTEGHPQNDSSRRDPWIDVRDAKIEFQLTAPRTASQKISTAIAAIGAAPGFAPAAAVLAAYDNNPNDAPPSDYPSTEFTLDLLFTTVVLRLPFLRGAKREADGQLVADPTREQVKFTLPKIKMQLSQGSNNNDPILATLLSAGASGLDDPGDLAVAELITMDPPYAFIGASDTVGFGFRSAVLDLSDGSTPPDVLAQFGFDENWTGLYLPEIRLFVAPNGARDLAVDAGAKNLLIGLGQSAGITGDFDLTVLEQGSGQLRLGARFFDAQGRSYGITKTSDTTATVALPERTRMVIDIDGGRAPYTASAKFDAGAPQPGREFDFDLSAQTSRTILISVTDTRPGPPPATTLTITAARRATPAPALPGGNGIAGSQVPPVEIHTTLITQGGQIVQQPRLKLISETPTTATIALDADSVQAAQTIWTVGGTPRGTSAAVTVDVSAGQTVSVKAELPGVAGVGTFTGYYRFDQPAPGTDALTRQFAQDPENTHTTPAPDEGLVSPWSPGSDCGAAIKPLLQNLSNNASIEIKGYASFEGDNSGTKLTYNTDLARRRALGLRAIIEKELPGKNFNINDRPDMTNWTTQGDPGRNLWWKAIVSWTPSTAPGTITEGTVSRRETKPPTTPQPNTTPQRISVVDPPPATAPPAPPSWFKMLGAKVRIVQNSFVACEVFGKFDIQTAAENRLREGTPPGTQTPTFQGLGSQNPADGIIDIRIVVQIDDATDTVIVTGYFGADPADVDGLLKTGTLPGQALEQPHLGRTYLGMGIVFMPLLSAASGAVAGDGALAQIAVTGAVLAVPFTIASLGLVNVERIIWYGGDFAVRARPDGAEVTILLDIETAVSLDLRIGGLRLIEIDRNAPLSIRYKAVGLKIGSAPGEPKFQFRPMFDASRGFTIDVSRPGAIRVADPLGQILQILGARIARNNPLMFEVDLGFAIDLGVVSIERARVRMRLDPVGAPELTAFGAAIDIPGALRGRGYMELNAVEIKGQIDLTLVPVQVRIAAGIAIANIPAAPPDHPAATGVIVTLQVEFPVAIPLANSGLGIYGFLGLFAMNYTRNEDAISANNMAPALAWLKATGGEPTNIGFWKPKVNTWAFGVGAVLGTMGTSVIFNLKGVILLELPGPRLLLMMKAKLLMPMPKLKGTGEGLLLAVIDLDMGRGTLTIGISAEFSVNPLIQIRIPVEAFFKFNDAEDWHLYLGKYSDPIHAKILEVFEGTGYLMLSGKGFQAKEIGDLPEVSGFSIALGLHVSFVWGSKSIGLYAELAAGFDAIVGFSPFRLAGILYVRGSLHLFIVDISARAELRVDFGENADGDKISRIAGEICGSVDFFFFEVEGCVNFAIGESSVPVPAPPALVEALKLISRSPALVLGTGVDKAIDGGVADGVESDAQPPDSDLKVVPIDAIPTLMMGAPPLVAAGLKFLGGDLNGTPEAPADGFVQRGDVWFKYTVTNVELIGPVTAGKTPATWWKQKSGDAALAAQLALLSWVPEATPKAIGSSKILEETIKELWGTVCVPVAPPAAVFWTFLGELLGASPDGWTLDGEAGTDPVGTIRISKPDLKVRVYERWRCGDSHVDNLRGIVPAEVEGAPVRCPHDGATPRLLDPRPPVPGGINPVAVARGSKRTEIVPNETLTLDEAIRRINNGQPVARATLARLIGTNVERQANSFIETERLKQCLSRALAAPVYDNREPVAFGERSHEETVKEAWQKLEFEPGKLDDAVVIETGAYAYARFYLFVPRELLGTEQLVIVNADADENFLSQRPITFGDEIPPNVFPSSWTDAGSPWRDDLELLVQHQTSLRRRGYIGVLVEIDGASGADRVQIGLLPQEPEWHRRKSWRPFYIAAVEAMRESEILRFDYETTEQKNKQSVLENALGLDSADNALLQANKVYQIRVTWDAERERRPQGKPPEDKIAVTNKQQNFWFRTDAQPPARLDPWILCSIPGEGEQHFFASETVSIVFATNNVALIYDAYGKRLQAKLKAASFRPLPSTAAVPHPYPITQATLKPIAASVLSPWEEAVEFMLDGSCLPTKGERIRHTKIDMAIPLDLFTDYILDIEMVDKAAPAGTAGVSVFRRSFSTGAYRRLDEFAKSFQVARVRDRSAQPGKLQAIGVKFASKAPQGAEFDVEMIAAGLEPMPVPEFSNVLVFWETTGANPPQPAAVLIDSAEPMWRSRLVPRELVDPLPAAPKRWEMTPVAWLQLAEQAGGDLIVDKIVMAPGAQRALVTLKPNSRSKRIRLALKRIAQTEKYLDGPAAVAQFFTVLDLTLKRAPWEED